MNLNWNANVKDACRNWVGRVLRNDPPEVRPMPPLTDVVEQARQEWLSAQSYYNTVSDQDLVDYAVFRMQAAEKKYIYLLKQARQAGVTYSPYTRHNMDAEF
ncbi:MAG: YaaL family protein [Veillonellales bacterium]